ncbi:MAG: hypothetical protein QNJ04_14385 [Desulfobacterales bacterium]|nr:hypothetical protein [Desulfobacterales bacterium]
MPLTVMAVAVGCWPLRGDTIRGEEAPAAKPMVPFLKELAPFVFVIVCGVGLGLLHSNEYFDTNIGEVYRCLRVPVTALAAGGVAYFGCCAWGWGRGPRSRGSGFRVLIGFNFYPPIAALLFTHAFS